MNKKEKKALVNGLVFSAIIILLIFGANYVPKTEREFNKAEQKALMRDITRELRGLEQDLKRGR